MDDLLRAEAFVDLLSVVRQSIRISHPSYSLKKVETFYMDRESEGVIDAGGAIVAYEDWLISQDPSKLQEIEDYNREDCDSLIGLQSWLLRLRAELERQLGKENCRGSRRGNRRRRPRKSSRRESRVTRSQPRCCRDFLKNQKTLE